MRVRVTLSDPWDLGESLKWQPFFAELLKVNFTTQAGIALLKFDQALSYHGTSYLYAVAAPRHEGSNLKTLEEGKEIFCSFTGVSKEYVTIENNLSLKGWRGGLVFIGEIQAML